MRMPNLHNSRIANPGWTSTRVPNLHNSRIVDGSGVR
jgi:hypothetical protein